jgi:hypothetical protein
MKQLQLVAVVVAIAALGGCSGGSDPVGESRNADKPCAGLDSPIPGKANPPAGFTLPPGQTLLRVETQGKTSIVFATAPGSRDDLAEIRDAVVAALKPAGYAVTSTDQEPTFEADATITKGDIDDTVNVRPLCAGKVVVRYTLH